MKEYITEKQCKRLQSIRDKSIKLQKEVDKLYGEAILITEEDNGITFDYIYNERHDLESLLSILGLSVKG